VKCSKRIYLKGGFTYTVRTARDDYTCFHCGRPIYSGALYVEERSMGGVVRRYHYQCFNYVIPHKLRAIETVSGVLLCEA
jgi:hypothetical protein